MKKGREPPEPGQHGRPECEVLLLGGIANAGNVVRVGDTVRRPQRSWSAATHTLLRHLEAVGFEGAPRFLGADSQGREVLSYIPGTAVVEPYPDWALSDEALVSVADLLRAYHDAASTFDASPHFWAPSPPEYPLRGSSGISSPTTTSTSTTSSSATVEQSRLSTSTSPAPAREPGTSRARRGCGPPSGPTSTSPTGGAGANSNGSVYSWTAMA
jgi:hypothetical protein